MFFAADDYRFMAQAIKLAKKGWYSTHPNPRVGCVIVKNGKIIGEGFHRKAGELHAERNALADCAEDPIGATAYVTLEPCCHHGKTPPCTEGLIEAGIAEVVIAMQDPNPLVAGQGIEKLEKAGITVRAGLLEQQAVALNPGFIKRMSEKRPYVRCKLACSLDGRTAMVSGESVWISSEHSRRDVQLLRAESSAIVTGVGTVLADNPSLNVRLNHQDLSLDDGLEVLQPLRVILDAKLQTPVDAKMLSLTGEILIFCSHQASADAGRYSQENISVMAVDSDNEQLSLGQVLQVLAEKQVNEVLLETGATLAGSAIQAGLIDELIIYQAPHLMGHEARGLVNLQGLEKMSDRVELNLMDERSIGNDRRLVFSFS
ncbi:MAG: bifunctional diaminohydroxyphosphoribosylaminopyrimidine deaminase/5-amino-6-(5-phosphoribosylamino)uracil reductase RibD [Gammaproteobacteria bacterium]|nr:bifunctional diaminohydroxyphosphoribosylaminopyrimidine deaminase/5-amino-6-(5-phosphoribosylamino)uracil reductase RibD [Gammaproteobacteria bacterium]